MSKTTTKTTTKPQHRTTTAAKHAARSAAAPAASDPAASVWEELPTDNGGGFWRPEPGETLTGIARAVRPSKYGAFLVFDEAFANGFSRRFVNRAAALRNVPLNTWVRLTYRGQQDGPQGRHLYDVAVDRTRAVPAALEADEPDESDNIPF